MGAHVATRPRRPARSELPSRSEYGHRYEFETPNRQSPTIRVELPAWALRGLFADHTGGGATRPPIDWEEDAVTYRNPLIATALIALCLIGCGDSDSEAGNLDAGLPDSTPPPVSISGRITKLLGGTPIADARLCLAETSQVLCVNTDTDGQVSRRAHSVITRSPGSTSTRANSSNDVTRKAHSRQRPLHQSRITASAGLPRGV